MAKKTPGKKYVPKHTDSDNEIVQTAEPEATLEAADETEQPEPGVRKGRRAAGLNKVEAEGDILDIWERRILNPDSRKTLPIRIKTPGMRLRWINLTQTGRYQRARYEQGWMPVEKRELVDEREIFGVSFTSEGYVCRGEKQTEMLMMMPEAVYRKIQERRAELNQASYKNLKSNLQSAGSKHFGDKYNTNTGDQIAETAGSFKGSINFGKEEMRSDDLLD